MSRMTKDQEARFRDLVNVATRAREGGAFEELEARWAAADRWTTTEREVAREAWDVVESILGEDAPPESSWRAALTIIGIFGDGADAAIVGGALNQHGVVAPIAASWHGGGPGYFVESLVLGDLPQVAKDAYKRVSSHLAWVPMTPRERVLEARRRASAMRKVLKLKARHD